MNLIYRYKNNLILLYVWVFIIFSFYNKKIRIKNKVS